MRLIRYSVIFCVAAATTPVVAQEKPGGFGLSLGYFFGNNFQNRLGRDNRIQGIEVGADLTLAKLNSGAGEFRLAPSVVFGNASGSRYVAGNIYRLAVKWTAHQPGQQFYFTGGGGYAWTQELGSSNFSEHNGLFGFLGVGYQFGPPKDGTARPYLEARYNLGHDQVSGFSLSLGVRF